MPASGTLPEKCRPSGEDTGRRCGRIEAKTAGFRRRDGGQHGRMTPTHAWARRGERAEGSVPSAWGSTTVIAALGLDGVRAPLFSPGRPTRRRSRPMWIRCWSRNSARGTWWSSTTSNPTSLGTWRSRSSVRGRLSCPCRHTARTTTRSRSCGRSSRDSFAGSTARTKDGLYKAVGETLDSVTIQDILGWFNHSGLYATHG